MCQVAPENFTYVVDILLATGYNIGVLDKKVLERAARRDAIVWALSHVRLPGNRPWDFVTRPWIVDIYRAVDFEKVRRGEGPRRLVIRKCTQVGLTTLALVRTLQFATTYPGVSVGYYLPRQDDVRDLVTTKLDPILTESRTLSARLTALDSARTKQFGTGAEASFLHFMEASVMPRMLPLDMVVGDEFDLCDQEHMEMVRDRMDASTWKIEFYFSTPTLPGYGIDDRFEEESTACHWTVKCPYCGRSQVLDWDEHLRVGPNGPYLGCSFCDKGNDKGFTPESILDGAWVAKYPNRDTPGFWISQLMVPWISIQDLYNEFRRVRPKIFYNLRMGKPFAPGLGGLSFEEVREAVKPDEPLPFAFESEDGTAMGVDQGDVVYIVIARRMGDRDAVIFAETVPLGDAEERIAGLIEKFNVRRLVIDAMPNKLLASHLIDRFPSIVWMAFYTDQGQAELYNWKRKQKTVLINRTDAFDRLVLEEIGRGKWMVWSHGREDLRSDLLRSVAALKRENVKRRLPSGEREVGVWRAVGPDHFAHAWSYCRAALSASSRDMRFRVVRRDEEGEEEKRIGRRRVMSRDELPVPLAGTAGQIRLL